MARSQLERLIALASRRGIVAARDAGRSGIHSQQFTRLVAAGVIERVARGQYRVAHAPVTEHHALAVAARVAPRGVVCLLSALAVHELGTQVPSEVWIAVERGTRRPVLDYPPLRVFHFSGPAFAVGVEVHRVEGERVRVYGVAKTLADLFKFRNKVGLDVALEALREAWRRRRFTLDDLERAARACRVERVMRPYIEAVIS